MGKKGILATPISYGRARIKIFITPHGEKQRGQFKVCRLEALIQKRVPSIEEAKGDAFD